MSAHFIHDQPHQDLLRMAEAFLNEHNPSRAIPVPIEEIVDFRLDLEIVPIPKNLFTKRRRIRSYLSADMKSIYVDEALISGSEADYNFTLAHEIAHSLLHKEFYNRFQDTESWKDFHRKLAEHTVGTAETQADVLAGLILVPQTELVDAAPECFRRLAEPILAASHPINLAGANFWGYVAANIAKVFKVPQAQARIRLEAEGLWCRTL